MKKIIILHCWYNGPEGHWYPRLKEELEKKGYTTVVPDIPEFRTDHPQLKKVMNQIISENTPDGNTSLVGHSLGTLLALRLAERLVLDKLVLVAGWDFDDLTDGHKSFWKNKINHEKIKKNVKEIYVIHSDNDPYITAIQAEDMSKRLGAKFVLVKGAGHFTRKDKIVELPQVGDIFL